MEPSWLYKIRGRHSPWASSEEGGGGVWGVSGVWGEASAEARKFFPIKL